MLKYLTLLLLSLSLSGLYAGEERDLICKGELQGRFYLTPTHHTMRIFFQRQNISHANKKVEPGHCTFALSGMGDEWPSQLYLSVKNTKKTSMELYISPKSMFFGSVEINDIIDEMYQFIRHPERTYIIRAVPKKVDGKQVWEVKSIGWNNTL